MAVVTEEQIIEEIEENDPELAEEIRDKALCYSIAAAEAAEAHRQLEARKTTGSLILLV